MLVLGLVDIPVWLLLLVAAAVLLYLYGCRNHGYFKKIGIPGPRPLPFIGNMLAFAACHKIGDCDIELRKKYGDLVGCYMGSRPNLLVYNQELVSQVMVKQFPSFQNRQIVRNGNKIMESMLTNMEDETWKHARSTMSPTFTTGKLRQMAGEINRCAKQLAKKMMASDGPFETRELAGDFSMDVILSTAFGLRVDSQSRSDNPFVVHARKMVNISFDSPILILSFMSPTLGKLFYRLGFQLLDKKATDFFIDIVKQTMESRTEEDKSRTDFVQLMCNAKRGEANYNKEDEYEVEKHKTSENQTGLTEEEILGNAFIFFFAGYDTTSIGLTMLFYNLARNQDCQNKLHEEIDEILTDKEDVTYDDVMKMHYLDKCMQESLRIYPAVPRIDRVAAKDVDLNGIKIPKGAVVIIPAYALHHDPKIWEDPEKFNPERFSAEGKAKRNPIMWLPFGYGPRNCIGMRLATYELKVAVVQTVRNHRIVTCSKTEDRIKWKKGTWLKAENGIWLAMERRN